MRLITQSALGLVLTLAVTTGFAAQGKRDTGATFSNPANMSMFSAYDDNTALIDTTKDQKLSVAFYTSWVTQKFTGSTVTSAGTPLSGSVSHDDTQFVPEIQFSHRLNKQWVFGLKIGQPYVSKSTYPADSAFSGAATFPIDREVKVLNISPELAFDINKWLAFGMGIDISDGSLVTENTAGTANTLITNKLSAWGIGWHAGALVKPWLGGFLGVAYYSPVRYDLTGTSELSGAGSVSNKSNDATSVLTSPYAWHIDFYQAFSREFGVMLGAQYTHWSEFQDFTIKHNYAGATSIEPLGYKDTWKYSVGARYQVMSNLTVNAGVSYDNSPSAQKYKTPTSIEPKNYWSAGVKVNYNFNDHWALGVSYGHAFLSKNDIDIGVTPSTPAPIKGETDVSSNQLGVFLTSQF